MIEDKIKEIETIVANLTQQINNRVSLIQKQDPLLQGLLGQAIQAQKSLTMLKELDVPDES